jgi:hypothetical protein
MNRGAGFYRKVWISSAGLERDSKLDGRCGRMGRLVKTAWMTAFTLPSSGCFAVKLARGEFDDRIVNDEEVFGVCNQQSHVSQAVESARNAIGCLVKGY